MSNATESVLVIGSGSIARRHIRNLRAMYGGFTIVCVSASGRAITLEETGADRVHRSLNEALTDKPAFAIVASPAPCHLDHAQQLLSKRIPTLIEKPLAASAAQFLEKQAFFAQCSMLAGIGYNLRYLPSAKIMKSLLEDGEVGRVLSVSVDVGQYLPDWRPGTDYRANVSARASLGGGALLELSHELDYLIWFFGMFDSVYGVIRTSGLLELDVEDGVDAILCQNGGLVATVHLDFLQRSPTRTCKVVGELGTLVWNVLDNTVIKKTGGGQELTLYTEPDYDRNETYIAEIRDFTNAVEAQMRPPITLESGLQVLQMVEAVKESSISGSVVVLKELSL